MAWTDERPGDGAAASAAIVVDVVRRHARRLASTPVGAQRVVAVVLLLPVDLPAAARRDDDPRLRPAGQRRTSSNASSTARSTTSRCSASSWPTIRSSLDGNVWVLHRGSRRRRCGRRRRRSSVSRWRRTTSGRSTIDDREAMHVQRGRAVLGLVIIGVAQIGTLVLTAIVNAAGLPGSSRILLLRRRPRR